MSGPQVLLGLQDAGPPPVTSTATWGQAAATWDATLAERIAATATWAQTATWDASASERFTSTASFVQAAATWDAVALERLTATAAWAQSATWDATALAANPVTSTASWEQAVGGQTLISDTLPLVLEADGSSQPLVADNDTGGWLGLSLAKTAAVAAFAQDATWAAAASESIPSTATWSQDASWAALGLNAEDVLADAEWVQEAASWLAATAQLVVGSGTWEQVNTWLAESVQAFTSTATWEQSQTWESAGDVANQIVPVDATGEWTQAAATWAGLATTPDLVTPDRPRIGPPFRVRFHIDGVASFGQEPASWAADMTVVRRDAEIEELLLVSAI